MGAFRAGSALVAAVALMLTAAGWIERGDASPVVKKSSPPNFVVILTDDMALTDIAKMPNMRELIGEAGATFRNYFVSDPLCCPSRVSILRGQYAHNTGVKSNGGSNGGFEAAYQLGVEHDTIATRLRSAGYRTALFGKYLNW